MTKEIKFQLSDEDFKIFMQKVREQFGNERGSVRRFIEWISHNSFAVLDPNLKLLLKSLTLKSS